MNKKNFILPASDVPALEVKHLTMAYGETEVFSHVELNLPQGVRACILGPNGAGKSTFLKGLLQLEKTKPYGDVNILGHRFKDVRKHLAYIPQTSEVHWDFPTTVFDVVLMGTYVSLGWFRRPKKAEYKRVEAALRHMGIEELAERQISQLSGGQKQRVFLARALVQEAYMYFLDEPLAGVDAVSEKVLMQQLKHFQEEGKTSLTVHHDLQSVEEYFDYVIFFYKGIVAHGSFSTVFTPENIQRTYKGDD